jgi:hypothetical protein
MKNDDESTKAGSSPEELSGAEFLSAVLTRITEKDPEGEAAKRLRGIASVATAGASTIFFAKRLQDEGLCVRCGRAPALPQLPTCGECGSRTLKELGRGLANLFGTKRD